MRVRTPWRASYDPALAVVAGECVTVHWRDDEFPGWVWATNAAGFGGWIPECWQEGGVMRRGIDTAEATVLAGEDVDILEEVAGWARVTGPTARGWVPCTVLAR